ncbi:hypothetical protein T01_6536, partial [Trichinella spiralis]
LLPRGFLDSDEQVLRKDFSTVPFLSRKLEVKPQYSGFFQQIIQYSDITPGS